MSCREIHPILDSTRRELFQLAGLASRLHEVFRIAILVHLGVHHHETIDPKDQSVVSRARMASGGFGGVALRRVRIRREPVLEAGSQSGNGAAISATRAPANRPEDEKAIKQITELFVKAFNAGDAKAVASLYTSDAELIDEYGDHIDGRPTIESFYSALFAERKGATIEVSSTALRFLGPEVARESGQTCVKVPGGEPASYRDYTVVYIKQDGRWLHSSVREEFPTNLAHHERLRELDWTLGEWLDESSESSIRATCRWSEDKNFLLRDFEIQAQGKPVMKVTERIGWDPVTKQIKSWVFDSMVVTATGTGLATATGGLSSRQEYWPTGASPRPRMF